MNRTGNGSLDVLIALYLIPDLARRDFESCTRLVDDYAVSTSGMALVVRDAQGEVHVKETGDHAVRNGLRKGAFIGGIAGLFVLPLIGVTVTGGVVLGALAGAVARREMLAGIADRMRDALPPGSAGIIAVYDHSQADAVGRVLTNAIRTATVQIEQASPAGLKEGLQKASESLAG